MSRAKDSLRYHTTRARMHELYPAVFGPRGSAPIPLRLGIHEDILADPAHSFGRGRVGWFLRCWTGRREYIEAIAAGGYRHALDGSRVCPITADEQGFARRILAERAQQVAA